MEYEILSLVICNYKFVVVLFMAQRISKTTVEPKRGRLRFFSSRLQTEKSRSSRSHTRIVKSSLRDRRSFLPGERELREARLLQPALLNFLCPLPQNRTPATQAKSNLKPRLHYNILGTARVPLATVPLFSGTARLIEA